MALILRNTSWPTFSDWTKEFDQIFGEMNRMLEPWRGSTNSQELPSACDIHETDSNYILSIDLPGVNKDDINVEARNAVLTVTAERSADNTVKNTAAHRIERPYGKFQRSFRLPEGVALDNVQANYENGVLYLTVPKAEIAKPKRIEIGTNSGGFFKGLLGKKEEKEPIAVTTK